MRQVVCIGDLVPSLTFSAFMGVLGLNRGVLVGRGPESKERGCFGLLGAGVMAPRRDRGMSSSCGGELVSCVFLICPVGLCFLVEAPPCRSRAGAGGCFGQRIG
jgi:hypothetical protein